MKEFIIAAVLAEVDKHLAKLREDAIRSFLRAAVESWLRENL